MISGILIALMLALFIGLFVWAYTPGRKQRFQEAAALALVDDVHQESPTADGRENRT
jgi:cbb3-type cytochrome oxidase subunit 3